MPWELSLPADEILRIKPIRELGCLRYNEMVESGLTVKAGELYKLKEISGDTVELAFTIKPTQAVAFGVKVLCDKSNKNGLNIFYSVGEKRISVKDEKEVKDPDANTRAYADAPFELKEGEGLNLRIFIDRSLVEIFINDRQAIVQMHLHQPEDVGICMPLQ